MGTQPVQEKLLHSWKMAVRRQDWVHIFLMPLFTFPNFFSYSHFEGWLDFTEPDKAQLGVSHQKISEIPVLQRKVSYMLEGTDE